MTSMLFSAASEEGSRDERMSMASAPMGTRVDHLGRYKMPLLPGEKGPKAGGDWVPRGIQSATNLAGAIVESRQLGIWERELSQVGLVLRPELYEQLTMLVHKARAQDVDFLALRDHKAVRDALAELHGAAKAVAGGDQAARAGTNRHDVWEERAPRIGQDGSSSLFGPLIGTPQINREITALEALLAQHHLERVPGLQERTVRNVALRAAGRFDDILRATQDIVMPTHDPDHGTLNEILPKGTLLMADLKTKKRKFFTWLEVRIQLTVYATAEWMLSEPYEIDPITGMGRGGAYVPGPVHHVDQGWGVALHMPSNGDAPELRRVNLVKGYQHAILARAVVDARSEAKNVAAHDESAWPA